MSSNPSPSHDLPTQEEFDRRPRSAMSHDMTLPQVRRAKLTLHRVVNLILDGNNSELARRCGVTSQATLAWLGSGVVPIKRVRAVCDALEGHLSDFELRPDVFSVPADYKEKVDA